MKITFALKAGLGSSRPTRRGGFTLPEMMVAMAVFVMTIGSLIAAHMFGLRMFELSKAKLGAADEARVALYHLVEEIRTNKLVLVGRGDASSFVEIPDGSPQTGNALQLYPTNSTNSSVFVRYFMDTNDSKLKVVRNGDISADPIVNAITNAMVFTAEDGMGNVLTNNDNNRVISLFMQIVQLRYPRINIATGGLFDYYQLRSKATRRTL